MAFKMVAVDMDWTILDLEKRIPMEVFEGFKRITLAGGYVLITTGRGMESASKVFSENDYPLGRDGYPHALAVASKLFYLQDGEYAPDEVWTSTWRNGGRSRARLQRKLWMRSFRNWAELSMKECRTMVSCSPAWKMRWRFKSRSL